MTLRSWRLGPAAAAVVTLLCAGSPAAAQNVTVTAADPPSGPQDTLGLVVKITGRNFAPGARSEFFKSGTTDPSGITVRATQFVSATEVDALLDIAATASISSFDIKVTNTSGRSGKGSDLFKVVEKSSSQPVYYTFGDSIAFRDTAPTPGVAGSGDGVLSDGRGTYANGVTGVDMKIYTGSSGDLITGLGSVRTVVAQTTPDRLVAGGVLTGPRPSSAIACTSVNVLDIWSIPVPPQDTTPTPVLRTAAFGCTGLTTSDLVQFGPHNATDAAGQYSTQVWVTRWSKTSWTVSTDPAQTLAVYSTQTSKHPVRTGFTAQYVLPFQFTVMCSLCAGVN